VGVAAYILEFFVNASANLSGYGEGQTYIGTAIVTVDPKGNGAINACFPAQAAPSANI